MWRKKWEMRETTNTSNGQPQVVMCIAFLVVWWVIINTVNNFRSCESCITRTYICPQVLIECGSLDVVMAVSESTMC